MTKDADHWIAPAQVFEDGHLRRGMALRLAGGRVAACVPLDRLGPGIATALPGLVTPGYVDLQVNGGGGVMLNDDPSPAGLAAILAAHRRFGTVAVLPTVLTDAPERLDQAATAVLAAGALPGLLGLHIEGPHIAPARRGTHAARFIRPLDARSIAVVARLRAAGIAVKITLAPEAARPDQISQLADLGALVSLGHSDATAPQARAAMAAGARCVTHLFNAMSQMQGRAPGLAGAAIASDCHVGVICDGHHVDDTMIALAWRARPVPDRMFVVSDAMATVGGPEAFTLYGQRIAVTDGRLVNAEGALAGAHITMAQSVQRLVAHVGLDVEQALRMAVSTPAGCLGRPDLGQLVGRSVADVIVLDQDLAVRGDLGSVLVGAEGTGPGSGLGAGPGSGLGTSRGALRGTSPGGAVGQKGHKA